MTKIQVFNLFFNQWSKTEGIFGLIFKLNLEVYEKCVFFEVIFWSAGQKKPQNVQNILIMLKSQKNNLSCGRDFLVILKETDKNEILIFDSQWPFSTLRFFKCCKKVWKLLLAKPLCPLKSRFLLFNSPIKEKSVEKRNA